MSSVRLSETCNTFKSAIREEWNGGKKSKMEWRKGNRKWNGGKRGRMDGERGKKMGEGNGEENGREREEWLSMCMCVLLTNSSVAFFLSSLSFSSSLVDLDSYWSDYSHCKQRREKEKKESEREERLLFLSSVSFPLFPPYDSLSLLSTLSSQARLPYTDDSFPLPDSFIPWLSLATLSHFLSSSPQDIDTHSDLILIQAQLSGYEPANVALIVSIEKGR